MAAFFSLENTPFQNFQILFENAEKAVLKDVNAMSLATCSSGGTPSVRTVLFKGLVRDSFSFYTNYNSQKAQELDQAGKAAALFFWTNLDQQIRIDGLVEKMTRVESEAYFKTRPRISQIGAWASSQSQKVSSLQQLQDQADAIEAKYLNQEIPCPPHWGGYLIVPLQIEFWFGRQGRMHERYIYERKSVNDSWQTFLKCP